MSAGAVECFFVDTNILLYALAGRDPARREPAAEWLSSLWETRAGRISWQVLNEFYANAGPKLKLPVETARRVVRDYVLWQPVGIDSSVIERAWHWTDQAGLAYWDGLILASAEKLGCRRLLSEDFQHGRSYGSVKVLNPFSAAPGEFFSR